MRRSKLPTTHYPLFSEDADYGKAVGIDLGTTDSVVAVMGGGKPTVIINNEDRRLTPSVVAFTKPASASICSNWLRAWRPPLTRALRRAERKALEHRDRKSAALTT